MIDLITPSQISKFAAVYAEAVLTFLDSGEAQWVLWDREQDRFDFASIELDQPEVPVLLFVDAAWTRLCEPDAETDPESRGFDAEELREAIEVQLRDEGLGERILKKYLERLKEIEEGDADDSDAEPLADADSD